MLRTPIMIGLLHQITRELIFYDNICIVDTDDVQSRCSKARSYVVALPSNNSNCGTLRLICRYTFTQIDRSIVRYTLYRYIYRYNDKQIGTQLHRQMVHSYIHRQIGTQLHRQIGTQLHRQIGAQLYRQIDTQLYRQIDRQIRNILEKALGHTDYMNINLQLNQNQSRRQENIFHKIGMKRRIRALFLLNKFRAKILG